MIQADAGNLVCTRISGLGFILRIIDQQIHDSLKRLDRRSKGLATKRKKRSAQGHKQSTTQVGLPKQSATSAEWGNPIDVEHITSFSMLTVNSHIFTCFSNASEGFKIILPDVEELNWVLSKQNKNEADWSQLFIVVCSLWKTVRFFWQHSFHWETNCHGGNRKQKLCCFKLQV